MTNNFDDMTPTVLTLLLSNVLISALAVLALVAESYKDTLLQCIGLVGIAFSSFVAALQIIGDGQCSASAVASLHVSIALFGASSLIKHMRRR